MPVGGSKGGIFSSFEDPQGFDIPVVKAWKDIGSKKVSGVSLFSMFAQNAIPKQVEVGIGNTCGLQCKQCFLGYEAGQMNDSLIPMPRLLETLTEFINDLGTRIICATDRDALTPGRSIPLFEHLQELRSIHTDLKFGGVTNGLAIHKFADDLARIKLDYLDISIDGMQEEHDAMRGLGTFNVTIENLRIAVKRQIAERIMVSTTLTRFNAQSIIDLICSLSTKEQVQWFNVAPLMAVKMQEYQLGKSDIPNFLDDLFEKLAWLNPAKPVTIYLEVPSYGGAFLPSLIESRWLVPEEIRQDSYGHLYQEICVNDLIKVVLRPELIPEYWRHTLRISADGFVIGGCEPLTQSNYHQFAIGNIKDETAQAVYAKAIALGSPLHKMMMAYDHSECRNKACFQHCLGGDPLLAKAVYGNYNVKDPNCTWDEYQYKTISKSAKEVALVR